MNNNPLEISLNLSYYAKHLRKESKPLLILFFIIFFWYWIKCPSTANCLISKFKKFPGSKSRNTMYIHLFWHFSCFRTLNRMWAEFCVLLFVARVSGFGKYISVLSLLFVYITYVRERERERERKRGSVCVCVHIISTKQVLPTNAQREKIHRRKSVPVQVYYNIQYHALKKKKMSSKIISVW